MSEPKVLSSRVLRVEFLFTIKTNTEFRELIQEQKDFFQKQKIRVNIKGIAEEHATRLGHIVGPIVARLNMGWHEETIQKLGKMDVGDVELKRA